MDGIPLLAVMAALLVTGGAVEAALHRRRLARIPVRVHVNGTRGKSSVTRLIAAGLRAGGVRTVAKTTGTLPRLILPDGREEPIERRGRANVIEQLGVVRRAVDARAEALVIECMALQPMLQSLCELDLVRSTHGVITNARADHLDVMGPTSRDVAKALAGTTPKRGRLFTAERTHADVFAASCRDRGSLLEAVDAADVAEISDDELRRFPYVEHADNVALALRVCRSAGVDRQTALAGMWSATPDPGALTVQHVDHELGSAIFVNAFAANDPESTAGNWNVVRRRFPWTSGGVAIVNCRADRSERTEQLAEMCATLPGLGHVVLVGTGTRVFGNRFERERSRVGAGQGSDVSVVDLAGRPVVVVAEEALRLGGASGLLMGMGNVAGPGLELVRLFEELGAEFDERGGEEPSGLEERAGHSHRNRWQEAA